MKDNEKGDKPIFKGNLGVSGWINSDKDGKRYISINIGNRVYHFRNDLKLDEEYE